MKPLRLLGPRREAWRLVRWLRQSLRNEKHPWVTTEDGMELFANNDSRVAIDTVFRLCVDIDGTEPWLPLLARLWLKRAYHARLNHELLKKLEKFGG
jgi:hypothetical protein